MPVAVMTYVNPVCAAASMRSSTRRVEAGVAGVIVPDLPVDESPSVGRRVRRRGIDAVLLAAPGTPRRGSRRSRTRRTASSTAWPRYGVTGARDELGSTAEALVAALRPMTDLPLLVGVGDRHARAGGGGCAFADGVIVGSALMARMRRR